MVSELEFCVKNLSYPLGMLLEKMKISKETDFKKVRIEGDRITVPDVHFAVLCYGIAKALFNGLGEEDREKLKEDLSRIEAFINSISNSKLGEKIGDQMGHVKEVEAETSLRIDWEEFERRKKKLGEYEKRVRTLMQAGKEELLEKSGFLRELNVDECLLLQYVMKDRKEKELVDAAMGKHNVEFRKAVMGYFRMLKA